MFRFSINVRVRTITMLLLVIAVSNTENRQDIKSQFRNYHSYNFYSDQCHVKSKASLTPIINVSERPNSTVNSVKPIPEEGSSLTIEDVSLRITNKIRRINQDSYMWRTRSLCTISTNTKDHRRERSRRNRKRTLLDNEGPVLIDAVEDSLYPDSLAAHIRVKRHRPFRNNGPSYLKDLANSFPQSFLDNNAVYHERETKQAKRQRDISTRSTRGITKFQPVKIISKIGRTERSFAESSKSVVSINNAEEKLSFATKSPSEISVPKRFNYTSQVIPKMLSVKEHQKNPTLLVNLIRRKRNSYTKIQTADNDDDSSLQRIRDNRGLPENLQRRKSAKHKRRNRKKHSKKKQSNRKKLSAKVAAQSPVHRKERKTRSKSGDAPRSKLVNKADSETNFHHVDKRNNIPPSPTRSSSKYNSPSQSPKINRRSAELQDLNENAKKVAPEKAVPNKLTEGTKLRMKRDQSAKHGSRRSNAGELKYYEDVREPDSTSSCTDRDGTDSEHRIQNDRAARSIDEVKELTEKLVAKVKRNSNFPWQGKELISPKVSELRTYLSDESKESENRPTDDLCSNVSTVCAVFEKTPRIVQRCGTSSDVGYTTARATLARDVKIRQVEVRSPMQRNGRSYDGSSVKREARKKSGHKWGAWTDWSSCSVTCGKGRQIRWRYCLHDCSNAETEMEEKACQLPACPPGKFLGIF